MLSNVAGSHPFVVRVAVGWVAFIREESVTSTLAVRTSTLPAHSADLHTCLHQVCPRCLRIGQHAPRV
jgi:hypothetical protein